MKGTAFKILFAIANCPAKCVHPPAPHQVEQHPLPCTLGKAGDGWSFGLCHLTSDQECRVRFSFSLAVRSDSGTMRPPF